MRRAATRIAPLTIAAALLAIPAGAFAHGTVYTDNQARAVAPGDTAPIAPGDLQAQTRYVITNHGYSFVLRETNGATDKGMVNFARVPGAYRNQAGFEPGAAGTRTRLLSEADTGAQPHATCRGVSALSAETAVLGWQGSDPFYNYVPFQKAPAGLEDDPAAWIEDVQTLTGVNLANVSDDPTTAATELAGLCTGLGGTFTPADTIQTTASALASGTVFDATEPLNAQIADLTEAQIAAQDALAASEAAKTTAEQRAATAEQRAGTADQRANAADADLRAARAEIDRLRAQVRPLAVAVTPRRADAARLTGAGVTAELSGPPSRRVVVRITLASGKEIARKVVRTSAAGKGSVTLKASAAGRRTLDNLDGRASATVQATSGDRASTVKLVVAGS